MQPAPDHHDVRFNVLGPLEAREGDRRLRLGGPVNERVLVMLLLEAGRVVPATRLVEAGWDEDPPTTAMHQTRKSVAGLRRRLPDIRTTVVTGSP